MGPNGNPHLHKQPFWTRFELSGALPAYSRAHTFYDKAVIFLWIKNCVASPAVCAVIFHGDYENLSNLQLTIFVRHPAWRHWYLFYSSKLLDRLVVPQLKRWVGTNTAPSISETALSAVQEMKVCQGLVGLLGKKAFENRQGFSHFMLLLFFFWQCWI